MSLPNKKLDALDLCISIMQRFLIDMENIVEKLENIVYLITNKVDTTRYVYKIDMVL